MFSLNYSGISLCPTHLLSLKSTVRVQAAETLKHGKPRGEHWGRRELWHWSGIQWSRDRRIFHWWQLWLHLRQENHVAVTSSSVLGACIQFSARLGSQNSSSCLSSVAQRHALTFSLAPPPFSLQWSDFQIQEARLLLYHCLCEPPGRLLGEVGGDCVSSKENPGSPETEGSDHSTVFWAHQVKEACLNQLVVLHKLGPHSVSLCNISKNSHCNLIIIATSTGWGPHCAR